MKNTTYLFTIIGVLFLSLTAAHAQQRERLIGLAYYHVISQSNTFSATDTLAYHYSTSRDIDSVWGRQPAFDSMFHWLYSAANNSYLPIQKHIKTWNTINQLQTDTTFSWDSTTHSYYETGVTQYYVDQMGRAFQDLAFTWDTVWHGWDSTQISTYYYNTVGLFTDRIYLQKNLSWDTFIVNSQRYDNAGLATLSSSRIYGSGAGGSQNIFSRDSLGRIDTTTIYHWNSQNHSWQISIRYLNSYDLFNNISSQLYQQSDSIGWHDQYLTSFTYDTHHNAIQYIEQMLNQTNQWINAKKYQATYDSYEKITWSQTNTWDTTTATWTPQSGDRRYFYYYETYTLPAGIAEIESAGDARIYPVPAAHMLSLDITWNEAQASTASIYDVTGRKQGEWLLPNTSTYHGYIPVANLPEGIYILKINGTKGSISKSFNVLR